MSFIYSLKMATDYGKRLVRAMEYAGINQKELVRRTGLKQSTVSSAINRSKGSSDTPAYAVACGVSALWLSIGDGEMHLPPRQATIDHRTYQPLAPVNATPVATETIAENPISSYAKAIGLMFDSLPDDAHIRARVMGEITSAILEAKRQPENLPPTAPAPVRSPKRLFS